MRLKIPGNILVIGAVCLLVIGAVVVVWLIVARDNPVRTPIKESGLLPPETPPDVLVEPLELYERISGRYLLAGTIVWDREVETFSRDATGLIDYEYPFAKLDSYSPGEYDAWLADLECPVSAQDVPYERGHSVLEFNCRPEFLPAAAKYFKFFNLANNHSDNSGRDKLEETRRALEAAGVQHFGDADPSYKDNICEVVALPIKLWSEPSGVFEQADLPVALCAWHYFYRLPLAGEIEVMEEYAAVMPVFAFLHMGAEYAAQADSVQRDLARRVIDAGAEFVIANNPHWVQDAELYKGKPIVYSTGNFIFDQAFNEEVKRSASIIVELSANYDDSLADWLKLGAECAAFKDDCLEQAVSQDLSRIDFTLNFDVVAGYLQNHQQRLADAEIQAWVRQRLGWDNLF